MKDSRAPKTVLDRLQIIGRRHADASVLSVAAAVERMRPWLAAYPGLQGA